MHKHETPITIYPKTQKP